MALPHGSVFAIVDGERFRLYRNTGAKAEPRLEGIPVPNREAANYGAGVHDRILRFPTGSTGS